MILPELRERLTDGQVRQQIETSQRRCPNRVVQAQSLNPVIRYRHATTGQTEHGKGWVVAQSTAEVIHDSARSRTGFLSHFIGWPIRCRHLAVLWYVPALYFSWSVGHRAHPGIMFHLFSQPRPETVGGFECNPDRSTRLEVALVCPLTAPILSDG